MFLVANLLLFVIILYLFMNVDDFQLFSDTQRSRSNSNDEERKGRITSLLGRKTKDNGTSFGWGSTNDGNEDNSKWFGNVTKKKQGRGNLSLFNRIRSAPKDSARTREPNFINKKLVAFVKAKNSRKQNNDTRPTEGNALAKSITQELSLPTQNKRSRSEGYQKKSNIVAEDYSIGSGEYQPPQPRPKSAGMKKQSLSSRLQKETKRNNSTKQTRFDLPPVKEVTNPGLDNNRTYLAKSKSATRSYPGTSYNLQDQRNPTSERRVDAHSIAASDQAAAALSDLKQRTRPKSGHRSVQSVLDRHKNSYHSKAKFPKGNNSIV